MNQRTRRGGELRGFYMMFGAVDGGRMGSREDDDSCELWYWFARELYGYGFLRCMSSLWFRSEVFVRHLQNFSPNDKAGSYERPSK